MRKTKNMKKQQEQKSDRGGGKKRGERGIKGTGTRDEQEKEIEKRATE